MKFKWIAAIVVAVLLALAAALLLTRQAGPAEETGAAVVPIPNDALPAIDPEIAAAAPVCQIVILSPADGSKIDPWGPTKIEWSLIPETPYSKYWLTFDQPDQPKTPLLGGLPVMDEMIGHDQTYETSHTLYGENLVEGDYSFKVQKVDANGKVLCEAEVHFSKDKRWSPEAKDSRDSEGKCNPAVERC